MSAKVKVLSAAAVVTSAAVAWLVLHDDGADELANARAAAADHAASLAQPATSDAGGTPRPSSVEAARDLDAPLTPAPTPPLVDPAFATLLVHAKWARDGTPAADVGITLYAWARADHYVFLPESRTDAKGVARFERIEPGPVSMFGDRCGRLDVHVEAGKVTELELVLPDGMDLDGTVVDGAGLPVAGADVWLGFEGNQCDNGTIVAKSDARGRFAIACVSSDRNVGARKPGFEPSPLVFVGGNAGTSMHLTLTLGGRGGVVRGRVVGPDEQPVAGAIVQLGDEHTVIPRGTSFPYEMLLRTNSDADGRFEFTGAMNGERPIVVRSRELAPWIGRVTVDPDLPAELLIHLPAGATLEGKVVDAKSQPIGGTQIELDTPSRLASATGSSALDGTYRIVHVLPGTFAARAEHERSGAKAGTLLSLGDGATTRWDVTLASGLTLRGRVLDEDGRPYPGCWVVAQAVISARANGVIDDFFERNATCDKNGCFSIAGCPDAGLDIRVEPPDHGMTPAAILHGVRASEELVIHVPAERRCSAWFVGTVVGEDGAPLDNATVHVSSPLSQTCPIETVEAHTGRFRMGPYAPADSVVHIRADGYAETMIAADHVAKDEVRDLGTIRMERGAPITVRARDEAGAAPANAWIAIRVAGTDRYAAATSAGEGAAEVDRAAPGDYDVTVQAPGYVPAWKTVTVANGQPVLVEFTLRRGRAVTLRPSFSRELVDSLGSLGGGGREASALLRDADRRPLARYGVGELEAAAKAGWSCEISLLPGRYVLDLLLAGDTASTATFDVPAEGAASEIALSFE